MLKPIFPSPSLARARLALPLPRARSTQADFVPLEAGQVLAAAARLGPCARVFSVGTISTMPRMRF